MSTRPGEKVAFSPGEFAALFSKSQTWGYRQIYSGKVTTITEYGRILIPASEVDRILATAGIYNGKKPKACRTKAEIKKLQPKLTSAWQSYLAARSANPILSGKEIVTALRGSKSVRTPARKSAISRLACRAKGKDIGR